MDKAPRRPTSSRPLPRHGTLPPPRDLHAVPRVLVAQLRDLVGEPAAVEACVGLLSGGDLRSFLAELRYLGGPGGAMIPDGGWKPYWARVWAARGLLYVWAPGASATVVAGVGDPHWRVAEMCLKVSAMRELAAAGDPSVWLLRHELPRLRATAVRVLGIVGDTEHVDTVRAATDDEDAAVRRSAGLALERIVRRLDLPG